MFARFFFLLDSYLFGVSKVSVLQKSLFKACPGLMHKRYKKAGYLLLYFSFMAQKPRIFTASPGHKFDL